MHMIQTAAIAGTLLLPCFGGSALADPVFDAVTEYMDFATVTEGIILPQQLTRDVFEQVFFVDARTADEAAAGGIPGALRIDWREIPGRLDEIPEDGMVVIYCNTGIRSAQATFAARLLGRDNVLVMQSGYEGWLRDAAYRPE